MTLKELYQNIGGDYDQAMRVLRMEKLLDKHIRKFALNGVVQAVLDAGQTMDGTRLFETAHAAKGVCGNLGLTEMYTLSSDISEEFRPGNARRYSDEQVGAMLDQLALLNRKTVDGIHAYEQSV